jgi:signal transduction histidine kinase
VAIWSTLHGWGPFAVGTVGESLVLLQLFMAVVALTGLLLGAVIAERDQAERHRAADYRRLEVGEKRLRLALEAGRMRVWELDIETGEVRWSTNPANSQGAPGPKAPPNLDAFLSLVHPDDRTLVSRTIAGAVDDETEYEVEFRFLWPDRSLHWTTAKGTVVRDHLGRPLRLIGVSTDVTERRRLEEELKARAAELAEADRRKDEFLAMLAHELRNPLAALTTALHLLAQKAGGGDRFLEMAGRQVKQLVRLVEDLLDVSRITQGRITLRREIVDLADVVARAIETVPQLAEPRAHALSVSLPAEPIRLEGDPARLAQVFANLLGNAAKYTPAGGSIRLTADRVGHDVLVRVADTGAGLAPELRAHIFDLFVQADTSLDRARGGLGIGLTVVRHLVELHGGQVEARSPGVGRGSEFLVCLPTRRAPLARNDGAPSGAEGAVSGRSLKVLVVEDNQDTAESLAMILQTWGHEARVALDGLTALDVAQRYRPDVVLSDVGLPHMDGYALARRLRERMEFGRPVLIALSGYGRDEDRRLAREAGFHHHLVKPPNLEKLSELLTALA